MGFKKGDRVRIRQWDDMAAEFGTSSNGSVILCNRRFITSMKSLCGFEFNLTKNPNSQGEVDRMRGFFITTDMIEPVEDDFEDTIDDTGFFSGLNVV